MPKGKCEKCGKVWYGWALELDVHRICDCNGGIIIIPIE